MQDTTENYIHLEKVSKIYGTKEVKIIAVDEISFNIAKGEFAVIVGPSGAGKTTVLNILGGMDTATSGQIWVDAVSYTHLSRELLLLKVELQHLQLLPVQQLSIIHSRHLQKQVSKMCIRDRSRLQIPAVEM